MVVLDLRRNAQRRERLLAEFGRDFVGLVVAPAYSVDQDQLARCLEQLAERERTVIVMTFYEEQTGEDLAGFLGAVDGERSRDPASRLRPFAAVHEQSGSLAMSESGCASPLDAVRSGGLLAGAAGSLDEASLEEHLLGCDDCSDASRTDHRAGDRRPHARAQW